MTDFTPDGKLLADQITAVEGGALAVLTSAEIDQQVATAHKWPRSLSKFKARATEMATFDEETAASCIYSRPIGKEDGKQKFAEGLSIRMAEIVGACFGNLRVGARLIEQTERFVKAQGYAQDLETNFFAQCEVIESTVDSRGKPYSERMRIVVAKATLSKARRDATFSVVPKALCKPIEEACRKVALGDASTLEKRRGQVMTWIGKLGIDVERVFAALNIKGAEEIGLEQLAILTGLKTAIKDGDVTVDETFPPLTGDAGIKAPQSKSAAARAEGSPTPRQQQPENRQPTKGDDVAAMEAGSQIDLMAPSTSSEPAKAAAAAAEPHNQDASKPPSPDNGAPMTAGAMAMLRRKMADYGYDEGSMKHEHSWIVSIDSLTATQGSTLLEWFRNKPQLP